MLDLTNFPWGRIEAPMGLGCGRVSRPHWRRSVQCGEGQCPLFSFSKSSKSTYGIGPSSLRFLVLCQSWILGGYCFQYQLATPMNRQCTGVGP